MDADPASFLELINTSLLFGVIAIVVLLFFSAMVSGAEVALFSLSQKNIEEAIEQNETKGNLISNLLKRPKKLLATLLIVNNFINIGIVIIFSFIKNDLLGDIYPDWFQFTIEVGVITFLILLFGEILPKVYANRNNIKFAKMVARPIHFLNVILSPINMPMRAVTIYFENKLGKQKTNISVNQLSQALELTSSDDTTDEEQKILEGIVSFGNTDTSQVMSPRIDVFALEIDESFKEILPKILDKGYSRIPVYRDNIDQVEGVLYVKDLLPHIDKTDFNWITLLREPFFVPENKKLDNLLKDFQGMKNHLAIVVDEYGGTSGVITLEDIIEEIVGDISDEFDDENINYSQIDDKNFLFEGKINLKDFYRIVDVDEDLFEDKKGEAETLAGFILEIIGTFPKKGQKIFFDKCLFTIESVDKKRVKQIKVTLDA
ncbi:MAG TPA: gliding motility-associated protein GldE [Flavobacterium sp.]|mgnify:CR=1 FL=1|uniref:gliding motility-associated protein GldE n=1 Tax=unclassified Flavobacterium TaxID=196869 RepID=UPI000E86A5C4|nr:MULTISPECIES: gliding motility-associated protein GldE [unclassified Flavobacterium]HBI02269.1 gliding motility-associated protein GldE [Flavobacterium sp.]HRE76309.1 gliding motility-associated protein GldE [Flavobacterium sp.]